MTKREKILAFLKENGIDIFRFSFIEEKDRYQKSGTIVIHPHYLTEEEERKLYCLRCENGCPIEVKGIRDHLEWQWGLKRIVWKGE